MRTQRLMVLLAAIVVLVAGCGDDATEETEPVDGSSAPTQAATEQTEPAATDSAPTQTAMDSNEEFLAVPGGYADCGATILTSGWPTTTAFNPELSSECILDAAGAGDTAQQAFWGRDNVGGIDGTILRVEGPGEITSIAYHVDPDGNVASSQQECSALESISFEPPSCAD